MNRHGLLNTLASLPSHRVPLREDRIAHAALMMAGLITLTAAGTVPAVRAADDDCFSHDNRWIRRSIPL